VTAALVNYNAARKALALAHRVDEVKSIRDKAMAMQLYAKQAKDHELIDYASDIKLRAERRLGEVMENERKAGKLAKPPAGPGRGKKGIKVGSPKNPTLRSQGIDKNLADRARKAAGMPEEEFEAKVASAKLPKTKQRKFAVDYEAEREAKTDTRDEALSRGTALVTDDPQAFIQQVGAEAAEAFARAILRALGVDMGDAGNEARDAGNAADSAELGADAAVAEDAPEAEDVPAPKSKAIKPGDPLVWDDYVPVKEDGGKRRGLSEPILGELNYFIEPQWDAEGKKAIGHEVTRRTFIKRNGDIKTNVVIKSGDISYEEAKAAAQADFDLSIPKFLLRTPPVTL
jgi:hypothetical protein